MYCIRTKTFMLILKNHVLSYMYCIYPFTENNRRMKVCKTAFMSLHGIGGERLRRVRSDPTPASRQGKHNNRPNKISPLTVEKVRFIFLPNHFQLSQFERVLIQADSTLNS